MRVGRKRFNDDWPAELTEAYRTRFTHLVRVAYLVTGQAEVAEELAQEAFLSARPLMDSIDTLYPYLRASVVNNSRSWLRRQEVERRLMPAPAGPTFIEPDEMWDALQTLDARRRAAIVLRFYEGLPDAEIAELLDCARATVRTLVHRGIADLRLEIQR